MVPKLYFIVDEALEAIKINYARCSNQLTTLFVLPCANLCCIRNCRFFVEEIVKIFKIKLGSIEFSDYTTLVRYPYILLFSAR